MKVNHRSEATSEDFVDLVKPCIRRAPDDLVIIHVRTNDLTKDVKTIDEIQHTVDHTKRIPIFRYRSFLGYQNNRHGGDARQSNSSEWVIESNGIRDVKDYIDNSDINSAYLSKNKLHLGKERRQQII